MPKIKTHRGAAKRFKKTGTGKIKRMRAFTSHMLNCKNAKRARRLRTATLVDSTQIKTIKRMLNI
ncbi:MAG: 50S ribosomal protein L35 [Thermodesulfovibrionales bacterium]|nr:50S ribosomal protein L35 [Thermodesulfovibrionales bacterium]